jgi:hypothetical protein
MPHASVFGNRHDRLHSDVRAIIRNDQLGRAIVDNRELGPTTTLAHLFDPLVLLIASLATRAVANASASKLGAADATESPKLESQAHRVPRRDFSDCDARHRRTVHPSARNTFSISSRPAAGAGSFAGRSKSARLYFSAVSSPLVPGWLFSESWWVGSEEQRRMHRLLGALSLGRRSIHFRMPIAFTTLFK